MSMFAELANVTGKDVKPPVLPPEGTYQCQFSNRMKENKAKSGNVSMRFPFKIVAPGADVDADDYQAALDSSEGKLLNKEHTIDFWMSPDARYRFVDFARAQGISDELGLLDMAEQLAMDGTPFNCQLKHSADDNDPTKIYLRWDNPTPVS